MGMSPKAFRAVFAVSEGKHMIRAPILARMDAKDGAVPSLPDPHHLTATSGAWPVVGRTGQEEGAGVRFSSALPPSSSFCVRRGAGLLLGLQNTRLRRV